MKISQSWMIVCLDYMPNHDMTLQWLCVGVRRRGLASMGLFVWNLFSVGFVCLYGLVCTYV